MGSKSLNLGQLYIFLNLNKDNILRMPSNVYFFCKYYNILTKLDYSLIWEIGMTLLPVDAKFCKMFEHTKPLYLYDDFQLMLLFKTDL